MPSLFPSGEVETMQTIIQHIRRPLPRKGGNQWYRAHEVRTPTTYCGADVTAHDVGCRDSTDSWMRDDGTFFKTCAACVAHRG